MIKFLLEKIKKNHALAMILCCGIPIVGILALSSLGPDSPLSFGTYLYDAGNAFQFKRKHGSATGRA
jgi:hypothetical protein